MDILSKNQRQELLDELKCEDTKRFADRIRVILLLDQGWPLKRISEALFLDPSTIHRYRESYTEGGLEQLIHDGFIGKRCRLTPKELEVLGTHLSQNIYLSSKEVAVFIFVNFGIKYSVSGSTALLRRLGFSYRKPDPKPAKANPEVQKSFRKRLAIIRSKMNKDDQLYFTDAAHPQMNSMPQYGWFKKGEKNFMPVNANRFRLNLMGFINIDSQESIIRSFKTINQKCVIKMIGILEKKHPDSRRINVIADNARYYRSNLVKKRLKKSKVRIIHLPAYSPNLNPIERLWKYLHKNILYNTHHSNPKIFKIHFANLCRSLRFRWNELETLLTYECQTFT